MDQSRIRQNLHNSLQASKTQRADFAADAGVGYNKLSRFLAGEDISHPTLRKITRAIKAKGWDGTMPVPIQATFEELIKQAVEEPKPVLPLHFTEPQETDDFQIHGKLTRDQRRFLCYSIQHARGDDKMKRDLLDLFDL